MVTNRCWTAVIFLLFLGFAPADKAVAVLKSTVEKKETQPSTLLDLPVQLWGQTTEFLDGSDLEAFSQVSKQGLLISERSGFQPKVPLLSQLRDTAFFPSAAALRRIFIDVQGLERFYQIQIAASEFNEGLQVLQALLKQPTTVGLKRVHLKTIQARLQLMRRALANRIFEKAQAEVRSGPSSLIEVALSLGLSVSRFAEANLERGDRRMDTMSNLLVHAASVGDKDLMSKLLTKVRELNRDNYAEHLAAHVYFALLARAPQELKLDEFLSLLKDTFKRGPSEMALLNLRVGYQSVVQKTYVDELLKQIETTPEIAHAGLLAGVAAFFAQDTKSINRFIQSLDFAIDDEKIQTHRSSKIATLTSVTTSLKQLVEQVTDPAHLEGVPLDFAEKLVASALNGKADRIHHDIDRTERVRLVSALMQKLPKNEKAWALLESLPLLEQVEAVSVLIRAQAGLLGPDSRLISHFRSLAGDISLIKRNFFLDMEVRRSSDDIAIIESIANDPELRLKYMGENLDYPLWNFFSSALIPYSSKDSKIRDFILERLRSINARTGRCLLSALGRSEELDPTLREKLYSLVAQSSNGRTPKLPILILLDSLSPAPVKKVPGLVSKISGSVATFFRKLCQ